MRPKNKITPFILPILLAVFFANPGYLLAIENPYHNQQMLARLQNTYNQKNQQLHAIQMELTTTNNCSNSAKTQLRSRDNRHNQNGLEQTVRETYNMQRQFHSLQNDLSDLRKKIAELQQIIH